MTVPGLPHASIDLRDDLRTIVVNALNQARPGGSPRFDPQDWIVDDAIGAMEELGACDQHPAPPAPPLADANPFAGLNADAMEIIGTLLGKVRQSDEWEDDPCDGWLASWRAARGEAAMTGWRWWLGGVEAETYSFDFATREDAIAYAPGAIAAGEIWSQDGRYEIVEARCWNDEVTFDGETMWFAEARNKEILSIHAEPGQ